VPISAVLFDFHATLAQVEEPTGWVVKAAAACGVDLPTDDAAGLAKALVAAGRAGGPFPDAVPAHLADVWERRDLSAEAHRAAYVGFAAGVECDIDGLPTALYDRLLMPDGWRLYADVPPVLTALRNAGVKVAMVSNIGFDLRPLSAALGIAGLPALAGVLAARQGLEIIPVLLVIASAGMIALHEAVVRLAGTQNGMLRRASSS